ncbi:MAG: hypothetical protein PHP29_00065 [Tissierellia bacterium]|nr:hypothetical protein [Tissierellia bacterium]
MTPIDRIAKEYVNLTLIKHQHHDIWDVYWLADTIFWKREELYIDRENRSYPYKPAPKMPFMSLNDILSASEMLTSKLEELKDSFEGNDSIRAKFLFEHMKSLSVKTRLLMGEQMPYDTFTKEMYSLVAPTFDETALKKAYDELDKVLPGIGALQDRIDEYKENIKIPADKLPAAMNYAAKFFHRMAVENMGVRDECMPRLRYWHNNNNLDFVTILFGYDYDVVSIEQNINLDLPYYLDNLREIVGHELEPGHFTFMNLRTKGAIDTGYPELGLNLHCPSSAFIEAGARLTVELALDTAEKEHEFDEKLFEIVGVDKKYIDYLPTYRKFDQAANYGKLEIERNFWNGVWTDEQARKFAKKYAIDYSDVLRFRNDAGHYTSHSYSTDMLRDYYNKQFSNTEEKWSAYTMLCQYPFSMKEIANGTFDPFAFECN